MKPTEPKNAALVDNVPDKEFIFGTFFMVANWLQTLLDREFERYGMTAKQWLLSVVVGLFESPPTLKEAAAVIGNTHQNVKQVALKLQANGFLEIQGDERDGRAVRLTLTEKSREFWAGLQQSGDKFMSDVFRGLDEAEMKALRAAVGRVWGNIIAMKEEREK